MRHALLAVIAMMAVSAAPGSAQASTFSNPTPITMPNAGAAAPANPYPSVINVAGLGGRVTDANVTLRNFSHECLSDADILLTGPGGRQSLLLSDAGGYCTPPAVGVTITLDDEATSTYPCDATPSGTFKPTNDPATAGHCTPTPDAFPPPAPSGPYPLALSSFDATAPNGAWSLFVFDEAGGSPGSIDGGWSIDLLTDVTNATCSGRQATKTGTAGNDAIAGTDGRDVIAGLGGNDTLSGLAGNDLICGGSGKDTLKGGGAKDVCKGGSGNDSGKCEVEKSV